MERLTVTYKCGETTCKGYYVYNEIVKEPRPAILIAHAWRGLDDFAKEKAEELAKLGYVAFAADLYGEGKTANTDEQAAALMLPLFLDRSLLRERIGAAYDVLSKQRLADKKKIGAIGFCFGGLTVIELLRSGLPVKGVVSFHGVLGNAMGDAVAKVEFNADLIKGSLLILHGHDDPLVSAKDIADIQKEFTTAGVDWQMHIYGHTVHAFTNPKVKNVETGLAFNKTANDRAWQSMRNFFESLF